MTTVIIILIFVGLIILGCSFFIIEPKSNQENLTHQSVENLIKAKEEADHIEEQVKKALLDYTQSITMETKQKIDSIVNENIAAVDQYSKSVLEEVKTIHKETMFLYSMLNEKEKEFKAMVLPQIPQQTEATHTENLSTDSKVIDRQFGTKLKQKLESISKEEIIKESDETGDMKRIVLSLYKKGKDPLQIARELELGVGEVKLIIDLFNI